MVVAECMISSTSWTVSRTLGRMSSYCSDRAKGRGSLIVAQLLDEKPGGGQYRDLSYIMPNSFVLAPFAT